ncbi:hypothetical protein GL263_03450 [Streptomyces durbertensis]|uniref:Integral membrane protein n=1 Tax=Streptomyces durbertensis TaxID=2448886 RepID=A0ABR6EBD8_9ACTN|nr:hypothetical protein [Streptomyces durbertensis]MBB1242631.1 hypothetical protein [Streptomyces durbertensis]
MADWWQRNVMEPGKLPLLMCLLAFVLTFMTTRTITRLIRAGKGPFRDVSPGGLHVHHVVPGILLATVGGFGAVAAQGQGWGKAAAAMLFGIGIGLVLDEFALVLHLSDVYWSDQGRLSVEIVLLTTAVVGLLVLGAVPFGVDDVDPDEAGRRWTTVAVVLTNFLFVVIACAKGKFGMGVVGAVFPLLAWVAAVRLARPDSVWARRFYREGSRRRRRAAARAARHDARWGGLWRTAQNALAGAPDPAPRGETGDRSDQTGQ